MQATAKKLSDADLSAEPSAELLNVLDNCPDLPSPPHIAAKIIELLKDPEADFEELMDSLVQDPVLIAKILKTANSAMYARRREVTNLAQALLTLGQSATTTLALSFSLVGALQDSEDQVSGFSLDFYWRRSLLAGFASRLLGKALGSKRCEELFLAGLLQDIGLMILGIAQPRTYETVVDKLDDHAALIEREIALHNVDHAWIGGWLLSRWELPPLIVSAVRHSHSLFEADDDPDIAAFHSCVALSGAIADVMLKNPNDAEIADLALDLTNALDLDIGQILPLLDQVASEVPEIESQFGMSVAGSEQVADIVQRARDLLSDISMRLLKEISDLQNRQETLVQENSRDKLTGLYNREKLETDLASWVARADKLGFPLSLAFMDLDGFKAVNDVHGHPAGDRVLKNTADLLSKQIRSTDTLARFGGDEFVLLLGGERKDDALVVCQRILDVFEATDHEVEGKSVDLSISIGMASLDMIDKTTGEALIKAADTALLQAKAEGKARVICFDELES